MGKPLITLILPFYNEVGFLDATLRSLAEQSDDRFVIIAIDNNSTDESGLIAARFRDEYAGILRVDLLYEPSPGKIPALQAGIAACRTPYFATIDADTIYPPDYVKRTIDLFNRADEPVCVMAFGLNPNGSRWEHAKLDLFARLFPKKCHTGGYGQAFSADAFRLAGGFDSNRWPFVLEDHEIVHRVLLQGPLAYSRDHVCRPSDRRSDRTRCSWTLFERVIYKLLPIPMMNWFFYSFIENRFRARGLFNGRLREKSWQEAS